MTSLFRKGNRSLPQATVSEILNFLGSNAIETRVENGDRVVTPEQFSRAKVDNVSFATESFVKELPTRKFESLAPVGLMIAPPNSWKFHRVAENLVIVQDPRTSFALVCREFFPSTGALTATPGPSLADALWSRLKRLKLFTKLDKPARQVIYPWVTFGSGCRVGPGTVIGGDGFGFVSDAEGQGVRFPHYGGVIIGDQVEIGSNVAVDRAVFGNTIIEQDVKIDNFVHIAHNVRIGANSQIAAGAVVCGSVTIGRNVWIGPGAILRDKVSIGDNARVGMGSVVIRSVEAGTKVFGNPAQVH